MNDLIIFSMVFLLLLVSMGVLVHFEVKRDIESRENLKQLIDSLSNSLNEEGLEQMDNLVEIYIRQSRIFPCLGELNKWQRRKNNYLAKRSG